MGKFTNLNWAALDWSRTNSEIARSVGCGREYTRQKRAALFPLDKDRASPGVDLQATVTATARKYGVPAFRATLWHVHSGVPIGKRGRKLFKLPDGWTPGVSIGADAAALGINPATLKRALRAVGLPTGPGRGRPRVSKALMSGKCYTATAP